MRSKLGRSMYDEVRSSGGAEPARDDMWVLVKQMLHRETLDVSQPGAPMKAPPRAGRNVPGAMASCIPGIRRSGPFGLRCCNQSDFPAVPRHFSCGGPAE